MTVTAKPNQHSGSKSGQNTRGGENGKITDGTYLVGSEVKIGNYMSSGGGDLCYADTQDKSGKILQQEVSQDDPVVIRIMQNAYKFTSNGCGSWHKVG